jgi:Zn finger protein HypA/HybF involved in hydrogenase expression
MKRRFLCKQCRYVFDAEAPGDSFAGQEVRCPSCRGDDVMEAPTWAPLGSGLNIFENDTWEYQCQECKTTFRLPIPKSPTEDKSRRCVSCQSQHLHLLTGAGALPLYCG